MSDPGPSRLTMAELRWPAAPARPDEAIVRRIQDAGLTVDWIPPDGDGGRASGFAFPEYTTVLQDGPMPLTVWIFEGAIDHGPGSDQDERALRHTYEWDGAADALHSAHASWLITEMIAGENSPQDRLRAFHTVLRAVVELTDPVAVVQPAIERVLEPADYLRKLADPAKSSTATVNVRMFRLDDRPGEMVMDTLGMAAFWLPDIQLHFRDLPASRVAGWLHGVADYVLTQGDVIRDGETVDAIDGITRWRGQHEMAMIEPERLVLDFDTRTLPRS